MEEESKSDIQQQPETVINPYTGRSIKIGGKAHQDMLQRQADELSRRQAVYPNGKTYTTEFLDNGQFERLKTDASEYTSDPVLREFLTGYINQLNPRNVMQKNFDFGRYNEEYENKIPEYEQPQYDIQLIFENYNKDLSTTKLNTIEQFKEYFACSICSKTFDAKQRIDNKSCHVCALNVCGLCYLIKLGYETQCPAKCVPNKNSFVDISKHMFAQFQELKFTCQKCNIMFNTIDFQQHMRRSDCKPIQYFDCPDTNCGAKQINRDEADEHQEECPDYRVQCETCYSTICVKEMRLHSCSLTIIPKSVYIIQDYFEQYITDFNESMLVIGGFDDQTCNKIKDIAQSKFNDAPYSDILDSDTFLDDMIETLSDEIEDYKVLFAIFKYNNSTAPHFIADENITKVEIQLQTASIIMWFRRSYARY